MQDKCRTREVSIVTRKEERAEKDQKLLLNAVEIVLQQGDEGTRDPLDLLIAREEKMIGRAGVIMDAVLHQRHWDEYLKAEKQNPAR